MRLASPPAPAAPARTGVWVGIAAITMSFAAYTSAMLVRAGSAPDWQHFRLPSILYANTVLLLASSGTLELARARIAGANGAIPIAEAWGRAVPAAARSWLMATLALGALFVAGQIVAWRDLIAQGLFLATGPSSAFFYVFTGVHAVHLLGGMAAVGYVVWRLGPAGAAAPNRMNALSAASLYWHFMGALWVYLLLILTIRM